MLLHHRLLRLAAALSLLSAFGLAPQPAGAAPAAAFVVNSLADGSDANLANPACETSTPGQCTLRAALEQANASAGPDSVSFTVTGTLNYTTEMVDITDTVTIAGPGANLLTLNAAGTGSVLFFDSAAAGVAGVSGLTLTGGEKTSGGGVAVYGLTPVVISATVIFDNLAEFGGGLYVDAGTPVQLINSVVRGNVATLRGGGVSSSGPLEIINTTIAENQQANTPELAQSGLQPQGPVGLYSGGGLFSTGVLTLTHSAVLSNSASIAGACAGLVAACAGLEPAAPTGPFGAGVALDLAEAYVTYSRIAGNYVVSCITCSTPLVGPAGLPGSGDGGGLHARDSLVRMENSEVVSNTAGRGGGLMVVNSSTYLGDTLVADNFAGQGGGLYGSTGQLDLIQTVVRDNWATGGMGGGLVWANGNLSADHLLALRNHALTDGGGLYLYDALAYVGFSQIERNGSGENLPVLAGVVEPQIALDRGGGLYVEMGETHLYNSSLVSNTATFGGGAVLAGPLELTNATVSGNSARRDGGGLYFAAPGVAVSGQPGLAEDVFPPVEANLWHVTLANNVADANNDTQGDGGALFMNTATTATVLNTLIALNIDRGGQAPACAGNLLSSGHNLFDTLTGCSVITTTGDLVGAPAGLGPLQFNGGFAFTHALTPASAALDAADPAQCHPQDERDVERPFGAGCDIGAFELSGLFIPLLFGD
jgi:CSLREA domain-containing protein